MTEKPKIDPLLTAMLERLAEKGPTWNFDQRMEWCDQFGGIVAMIYPGRASRKSRAKKDAGMSARAQKGSD